LLQTRVHVDLVGLDEVTAREALLKAARGSRGRPAHEPEFPGDRDRGLAAVNGGEAPRFPGDLPPVDIGSGVLLEESTENLRADDLGAIRAYIGRISDSLTRSGFSDSDVVAFEISLLELVNNVATHVRGDETVRLRLSRVERSAYFDYGTDHYDGLILEVADTGRAFDLANALIRSEATLARHGAEHGLLRAYRYGSLLHQISTAPHVMGWMKERSPQVVPALFGGEQVIPFIFSYRQEAIRVRQDVHPFFQFAQYLHRSEAFMDLIFDPLLRPARKFVAIEITGHSWSGSLYWSEVLDSLLSFTRRNARFDKQLLLFADVDPSEQRALREYCDDAGIVMFEDESKIGHLDESTIRALDQPAMRNREVIDAPAAAVDQQSAAGDAADQQMPKSGRKVRKRWCWFRRE
jgi:hypothetical protein